MYSSFWCCFTTRGILVPQPGIEPMPLALGAQSLNHWTAKEVLNKSKFKKLNINIFYYKGLKILVWERTKLFILILSLTNFSNIYLTRLYKYKIC